MKRFYFVFGIFLLLTACSAEPQEIPQETPVEMPAPAASEQESVLLEFSPVNPDPLEFLDIKAGKRSASTDRQSLELPATPFVEHDAFYFPLQFVAESMGVQYAFADGCACLQFNGHITQFFIDSPRYIVDGAEGQVEGERTLYREGLPQGPVDTHFTPLLRDGIVFLPVDYLPVELRRSYNSFGAQMCPENDKLVHFQNDLFSSKQMETPLAVTLSPNVSEALVDGQRMPLPAAPFVENGIFFFPVEAVAEWMGVGYSRTGDSFRLSDSRHEVQLFLNSRQYISNNQTGLREGFRDVFAPGYNDAPVDDYYVPVERNGMVFLPSDFLYGEMGYFWGETEYSQPPDPGMVIFTSHVREERGVGGFYLWHKFDETPPELRAGLHCIGKLGEYEGAFDYEYDIIGYAGNGLNVHVLRLKPGMQNTGYYDGAISSVSTTNPAFSTPRGLRCGDLPRRAWEIYGYDFADGGGLRYHWTEPNGPITAVGFCVLKEQVPVKMNNDFYFGLPNEWFETPGFWEDGSQPVSYIFMEEGKRFAEMGGRKPAGETLKEMPAAPFVEQDAFYFPLQFVAEAMGVRYAFADDCAYLQCDGHVTQFFMDSPRFIVDGVEGRVEGERRLYRKGRQYGPVDEYFTPVLRDGVVFLPVEYLPEEFRMSYNSFGPQLRIDDDGDQVYFQVHFINDRWLPTEVKTAHAVTLCAGVSEALADGKRVPLPAAPFVENDIFYFPLEAMAEWMEVGYTRNGDSIHLFAPDDDIQLFLNSPQYILNGQSGIREPARMPVERDGVVFLPSDFFLGNMGYFFLTNEYYYPESKMVIFTHRRIEEDGLGGFYLEHNFDETPPELRAGLHCTGKLGEFFMDTNYDVIGYTGGGLEVHVLRLKPDGQNGGSLDGRISAVVTTSSKYSTSRGLHCGDLPRRVWELYGYGDSYPRLRFDCPHNGPITALGFSLMNEMTVHKGTPYFGYYMHGTVPDEWFDTPAFWESA